MKKFTKTAVIFAVIFFIIGFACIIGSVAMGLTWGTFKGMVQDGKFSFSVGKIHIGGFENDRAQMDGSFDSLDIELGAGTMQVSYGDVESIQIEQDGVVNFEYYVEDETLHISGGTFFGISDGRGNIVVTIPNDMRFDEVDLEIGAGEATIKGLKAKDVSVDVGAGVANVISLDTRELNAQSGTGEIYIELVGSEEDYNYDLECGIGEIAIGNNSISGIGSERNISNPGADRYLGLSCGIGRIQVEFEG